MLKRNPNIAIVILAAGASKRMGEPKQLLKWGKHTLLENAIHIALQLNTQEVVVVLGANYEFISRHIEHYPITILNNKDWEFGLGKSIAYATEYFKKSKHKIDGVLITLADQPLIDVGFFERLIHDFEPNKNSIIATSYGNEKGGVPVLFDVSYLDELSELNTDTGAKHILEKREMNVKQVAPKNKAVDLDSKEVYDALYRANFNI